MREAGSGVTVRAAHGQALGNWYLNQPAGEYRGPVTAERMLYEAYRDRERRAHEAIRLQAMYAGVGVKEQVHSGD